MTTPTLQELSTFLGREARTARAVDHFRGPHEQFEFTLSIAGANVVWRVSPQLGYCQFLGLGNTDSPVEAFVKCDAIVIDTDIEEEGGQCIVMKADGWHVCLTPGPQDRLFFSIYGRDPLS